ncbi:MAG: septal ring lytic transglycosylase RlpA family protein [Acidobacteria bacterium]|nr:septal ring lytic transglycosylase RlpA family protein [Acidobacteriota bacterium]
MIIRPSFQTLSVRIGRNSSSRGILFAALGAALLSSACGRRRTVATIPPPPPASSGRTAPAPAPPATPGTTEVGYASWYGDPYHGRRAANGEIYDKNQMTAAHRTMPFETMVKVTNLENGRSTVVRITDRGPFVKGRIIDLTLAAAKDLAMIGPGTAMVRLEVQANGSEPGLARFAVQVGAFSELATAERLQQRLASRFGGAYIENYDSDRGRLFRVRVGPRASLPDAQRIAQQLENEQLPGFVVRLDN